MERDGSYKEFLNASERTPAPQGNIHVFHEHDAVIVIQ
jgi:hypothetical protein